jgi:hypothetical protein
VIHVCSMLKRRLIIVAFVVQKLACNTVVGLQYNLVFEMSCASHKGIEQHHASNGPSRVPASVQACVHAPHEMASMTL